MVSSLEIAIHSFLALLHSFSVSNSTEHQQQFSPNNARGGKDLSNHYASVGSKFIDALQQSPAIRIFPWWPSIVETRKERLKFSTGMLFLCLQGSESAIKQKAWVTHSNNKRVSQKLAKLRVEGCELRLVLKLRFLDQVHD